MSSNDKLIKTDLHCHILPGVDDGAKSLTDTNNLLESEKKQGITQIAFTPHYYADQIELSAFIENRNKAFINLTSNNKYPEISYKVGSEVHMVPSLINIDLTKLVINDTHYMLIEWPSGGYPLWGNDIVNKILSIGITPIFAHIERYEYFFCNLTNLKEYISKGCLFQINATTILDDHINKRVIDLIKRNYIHIISSDAHSVEHRPVNLKEAYEIIKKKTSKEVIERVLNNSDDIFNDRTIKPSKVMSKSIFSFIR